MKLARNSRRGNEALRIWNSIVVKLEICGWDVSEARQFGRADGEAV